VTRSPARDGATHPAGWRPAEEDERVALVDRLAARLEARAASRERRDVHLLRYVPGDSPLHRLWAGTKLVGVAVLSIGLFIWPTWVAEGIVAVLLLSILLAVRIPAGAVPRPPAWLWLFVALGAFIAFASGGSPFLHLGGARVGMGGLETWARFVVLAIEFLCTAALVGWTTPLAELAPALARLAGPLRKLRVPVDELAVALALAIRCLPLVVDELRTLRDARRARRPAGARKARELVDDTIELAVAALLSALRRAGELADAIEARGGATTVRHDVEGPRRLDAAAFAVLAVVLVAVGILA
jgi:energy-coupling factor transporter transmembrane protein EcfT